MSDNEKKLGDLLALLPNPRVNEPFGGRDYEPQVLPREKFNKEDFDIVPVYTSLRQYTPTQPWVDDQVTGWLCFHGIWPFVTKKLQDGSYFRFYHLHNKEGYWLGRDWDGQPLGEGPEANPIDYTIHILGAGQMDEERNKRLEQMFPICKQLWLSHYQQESGPQQPSLF